MWKLSRRSFETCAFFLNFWVMGYKTEDIYLRTVHRFPSWILDRKGKVGTPQVTETFPEGW